MSIIDCFYSAIFSISLWDVSVLVLSAVHQDYRSHMTLRMAEHDRLDVDEFVSLSDLEKGCITSLAQ